MRILILLLCALMGCAKQEQPLAQLKEVFQKTWVEHNPSEVKRYYHPDFKLYSNSEEIDLASYLQTREAEMADPAIGYAFDYDENTFVAHGDKAAARFWLTVSKTGTPPKKTEVILIVQLKDGLIYRIWEVLYPSNPVSTS